MNIPELPENDPLANIAFNQGLEHAAKAIEVASLIPEYDDNFNQKKAGCAAILADMIRGFKKEVNFQQDFFEAIRNDPFMSESDKRFWLNQESGK